MKERQLNRKKAKRRIILATSFSSHVQLFHQLRRVQDSSQDSSQDSFLEILF